MVDDQVDGEDEYVLGDELRLDKELKVELKVDVLLCVEELNEEPKNKEEIKPKLNESAKNKKVTPAT